MGFVRFSEVRWVFWVKWGSIGSTVVPAEVQRFLGMCGSLKFILVL